mmetsp:Transcript_45081/g.45487  ORF Transcript_45081/g.45487 Transcript_45081/m.45487 type:complete len:87 (+) Transcript_45081:137-397(+)
MMKKARFAIEINMHQFWNTRILSYSRNYNRVSVMQTTHVITFYQSLDCSRYDVFLTIFLAKMCDILSSVSRKNHQISDLCVYYLKL